MKYKALFLDFYGTLVHEDDIAISEITKKISCFTPSGCLPKEIGSFWWAELRGLFENSFGNNFRTQRELESISIQKTLKHFDYSGIAINIEEILFSNWTRPKIFEDTLPFLEQNSLPVCIVSNIDRNDILKAIEFHNMKFENIVTSEDAKSYKPRSEIFKLALDKMKLAPKDVLHIGDSLAFDVEGAHSYGIDSFWLNRKKRSFPHNCAATYCGSTLHDVIRIFTI